MPGPRLEDEIPDDGLQARAGFGSARSLQVLVVEDEVLIALAVEMALEDRGHRVTHAGDGLQALAVMQGGAAFDAVVTDRKMPRMSGDELIRSLRANWPLMPVVVMTADIDQDAAAVLRSLGGPLSIMVKPAPEDAVALEVERLVGTGGLR